MLNFVYFEVWYFGKGDKSTKFGKNEIDTSSIFWYNCTEGRPLKSEANYHKQGFVHERFDLIHLVLSNPREWYKIIEKYTSDKVKVYTQKYTMNLFPNESSFEKIFLKIC